MRARLKEMRNLCGKLKDMVYKAKDRIEVESNLYEKISDGLSILDETTDKFNPTKIRAEIRAELANETPEPSIMDSDDIEI